MTQASVLSVRDLAVEFDTRAGSITAIRDVSFELGAGEVMGLVGESGSGKSVTGFALMGLIERPGRVAGGSAVLRTRAGKSVDLLNCPREQQRAIRGKDMAMIFQDPMLTLNPVLRIDTQMMEAIHAHQAVPTEAARLRSLQALESVGIAAPQERLRAYPHQLSGGMRQRVAIAIALLNEPTVIIADEPTTALDVTIQGQILHVMQALCQRTGTMLVWITHDLSVVAGLADHVCVMYGGQIVERGRVDAVLAHPQHPYTRGLMASVPAANPRGVPLAQIRGSIFPPHQRPPGCAFAPRCDLALPACGVPPPMVQSAGSQARCIRAGEVHR